jgi:hypothetical protein
MKMAQSSRVTFWVPVLLAALIFCGCASISENTHAYLGSPRYAPSNPTNIVVFAAEPKQPNQPLGEIILSVEGNPPREKLEGKLRAAAAKLGADGVFIVSDRTHIYPMIYWDCWGPERVEDWQRVIVGVAFKNK